MLKFYKKGSLTEKQLELRELAELDLRAFVGLVAPYRVLGHCHHDMLKYFMEDHSHQLVLWPRSHQKSTMIAYWCCWWLIKNPPTTILYASATAALAEIQLAFMKQVLDSDIVRKYWPELLNIEEGRRTMWRTDSICVDHVARQREVIRDPSIKAVGMGANITGFHADVVILDDIVILENADTLIEREKVKSYSSLLTSVLNPDGFIKAVGTRYHPEDLYNDLITMVEDIFDEEGIPIAEEEVYSYSIECVKEGENYLWPRQQAKNGKWYGFNNKILSRTKAQYLDKAQFFAQYYNDPSDPVNKRIAEFLYYKREEIYMFEGRWCHNGKALNIFAAIDFAATVSKRADYTAIVVMGIDPEHNIFILDIDRFRTDKISEMSRRLMKLYDKWRWQRLRAEATAAQNLVVEQLREYNKQGGVWYSIQAVKPMTDKMTRIMTNLEPRYAEGKIFHYRGGFCQVLEDELTASKPAHDDVSDALASVVEIANAPSMSRAASKVSNIAYHPKWGGVC